MTDMTGVIIDGAIPRSPRERCEALFEHLLTISEVGPHSAFDPATQIDVSDPDDPFWTEFEDDLLYEIQRLLPHGVVVTVGGQTPGDVVIATEEERPPMADLTITATRHKNERWTVRVVYPDGSYAHHRGVVDYGHAGEIAERAVWKSEDMLSEKFSPKGHTTDG